MVLFLNVFIAIDTKIDTCCWNDASTTRIWMSHATKQSLWRHQMEKVSALPVLCAGNSPVTGEFPSQRPVTRSFDVFLWSAPWIKGWVNNHEAGDLRRHRAHYDVIVMIRWPQNQISTETMCLKAIHTGICAFSAILKIVRSSRSLWMTRSVRIFHVLIFLLNKRDIVWKNTLSSLTHWGRDKMDAIFQTTFSNGFSWMKMYEFLLKFHWSLFLGVQLTIFQHWFR